MAYLPVRQSSKLLIPLLVVIAACTFPRPAGFALDWQQSESANAAGKPSVTEAQQQADQTAGTIDVLKVKSRLVVVDVVVRDKKGQFVTGLQEQDFKSAAWMPS